MKCEHLMFTGVKYALSKSAISKLFTFVRNNYHALETVHNNTYLY